VINAARSPTLEAPRTTRPPPQNTNPPPRHTPPRLCGPVYARPLRPRFHSHRNIPRSTTGMEGSLPFGYINRQKVRAERSVEGERPAVNVR
jgi:hypothetical protein